MEYLSLIFLHVVFGIVWAGGTIAVGFFFIPSLAEAGAGGGAVMSGVIKRRFPIAMSVAGALTVLSGLRLYMLRFSAGWLTTPEGIALTLGGLLGLGALGIGVFGQKPTAQRIGVLSAQILASGAPPTPAQMSELQELRAKMTRLGYVIAWHLLAASVLMASHRLLAAIG
jgi:uncharacterized membrane protein